MNRLTRHGTAEPVSRDQIIRPERWKRKNVFSCSLDHEQDGQSYPVDSYSAEMLTINTCIHFPLEI